MKHFDDPTRKLIKNVAALAVSALILIAATVAWFSVQSVSYVNKATASLYGETSNEFYQKATTSTFTTVSTTTSGNQTISSFSGVDSLSTQVASSGWSAGVDWSIDPLIPGAYRQYKMVVQAAAKPSLHISGITASHDDSDDTALSSVYLQAAAFTASTSGGTTSYTQVGSSVCDTLYNLMDDGNIDVVFSDSTELNGFVVVINIGIPGEDVTSTHDTLRTLGASIGFTSVDVSTGESGSGSGE